jgi:hypothetical protein
MTKLISAGLEVDCDFLFFKVNATADNGDHMAWGFRVLNFQKYDDKDMDLKLFIENLKTLIYRLGEELNNGHKNNKENI